MKAIKVFLISACALTATTACDKEMFDEEVYNEVVDYQFMIDNVDRTHDWRLTQSDTLTVFTRNEGIYSVQILTENPYASTTAEIAAEGVCFVNSERGGFSASLAYTIPLNKQRVWVAKLNAEGEYLGVAPVNFGTDDVELDGLSFQSAGTFTAPQPQVFTYLYEDGFPMPGDFDFNDLVLRISKHYTERSYQVELTVTVEAVGTLKSYAAAIQLAGVKYDDVESVEIIEGEQMDKGYPLRRMYITSDKPLVRGRNGEAIVNLFENGHWVMNKSLDDIGNVKSRFYNTEHSERENYSQKVSSVTATYRVNFKSREVARDLSFDQIDPFIVEEYNGGLWEVHTYAHKFDETLNSIFNGNSSYYDNHISWCVTVPKRDFRYSVEAMSLGTYNSELGEVFGPYTSFADWMTDHTANFDWYEKIKYEQLLY